MSTIAEKAYHKYQLDWMQQNNLSLYDLMQEMTLFQYDDPEDSEVISTPVSELFEDWEEECGFNGSLWVCYDEFLGVEYQDKEYMKYLLTAEEYQEYLREML